MVRGMRSAMILAAGLGTRLRPLTDELPKPLVPVGDRPAIAHIQEKLARAGWDRQVVNTHYQMERFHEGGRSQAFRPGTVFVHEADILGTAGGVANAYRQGHFQDTAGQEPRGLLVWNGDILADPPLAEAREAFLRAANLDAVWIVAPRPLGEGTVGVDGDGFVCRVRHHCRGVEARGGDFLGISVLSGALLAQLPPRGCLVGDVLGPRLDAAPTAEGEGRIGVVWHEGPWDDLGSPAAYLAANRRWLAERRSGPLFLGDDASAPAGTTGILGAGARLTGRGARDVVLWPDAVAHDVPDHTIVTKRGVVVALAREGKLTRIDDFDLGGACAAVDHAAGQEQTFAREPDRDRDSPRDA